MIPYDDLVAALSSWRARQGLPVNTVGAAPSGPAPVATTTPGSGPRTAPPRPPAPPAAPEKPAEALDVDDAAMLEEENAYENEGSDFAVGFNAAAVVAHDEADATAIGGAPERPPEADPVAGRVPNRNDDW